MGSSDDIQYVVVHGYRRAFRISGQGPALLLLHGLACDSSTWNDVIPELSKHFRVIAPDLLGHGESDKRNADYSLGGYANGMRDLLTVLGIDKVTVVGHSFGGGVAMQFAYQFPDRTERVVLVSTGGLGKEVTPLIRFLTMPGSSLALGIATFKPWRPLVSGALKATSRLPLSAFSWRCRLALHRSPGLGHWRSLPARSARSSAARRCCCSSGCSITVSARCFR